MGLPPTSRDEFTILEQQDQMNSGETTAHRLCEYYLERIDQIDRHGPSLNAVIEINADAVALTDWLDAERRPCPLETVRQWSCWRSANWMLWAHSNKVCTSSASPF